MNREVWIRVDGSRTLGLGHVFRCLALAYMLQDEFTVSFFTKELPINLRSKIQEGYFRVISIGEEDDFLKRLTGEEIVVVDHYNLNSQFQQAIKGNGNFLVFIDDIPRGKYFADLIINHAPGVEPSQYDAQDFTQFALGLDYALLRPQFLRIAKEGVSKRKEGVSKRNEKQLFICFGGSDPKNLTKLVLEVAANMREFKNINVVLGQSYHQPKKIFDMAKHDKSVKVHTSLDENEMVLLMKEADVAVVPASGILMEALASGCRVISGMYVQNQSQVYETFRNSNIFIDAKIFEESDLKSAFEKVDTFSIPDKLIDGKSGERIKKLFKTFDFEERVKIRKATIDDLSTTYSWAANAELRQHSFTKKEISYEEHVEWFLKKIKDPACLYFIAEKNGKPLGSLRYDIYNRTALISYLVDPSFQGRGMGMILLKKALFFLQPYIQRVDDVVGYVMPENIASQKSFKRLGYIEEYQEKENKYKYSKKLYENSRF